MKSKERVIDDKNKTKRSKTAKNFYKRKGKAITANQLAIEETKKLYQKYYEMPNPLFISQLKTETLNIYLDNYKLNDISVINKILSKYTFTKNLSLSPGDPAKANSKTKSSKNSREPITEGEKVKLAKQEKDKKIEYLHIINKITLGIGKHLSINNNLESFSLLNFPIEQKLSQNLSSGICNNKSLKCLKINNCQMVIEAYEMLLKGLFNHEKIENLDLQKNGFGDKYGDMIARIISRQTDRRDQLIWLAAIRNEFPDKKDINSGLISINLNGNKLSSYAADCITTALSSDQYIRSIILSNNEFDLDSCKKFIYMLRRNISLLNIDLKSNPGYNDNIQKRLIIKMSKNIKNLYLNFKSNKITSEEFEYFKKFINSSLFFTVNIPEEVVESYNNNIYKIPEDNNNIDDNNINKENGMVLKNREENDNINKINDIKSNINKNKLISESPIKPKTISDNETEKLMEENLSLKKKILELKAENIKNISGKKINFPKKYKNEILNKDFKQAEELLDKLNNIMNKMENDNNIKDNIEIKEKEKASKTINDKIKIKNINLNNKNIEEIKSKQKLNENKKINQKEKEKKEINLNIDDDNNKNILKKEEKKIKNEKNDIKDNLKNDINNKSDKKKEIKNNKNNNIKKDMNDKILNLNEEDENEESNNLHENEIIAQHKLIYEQLKKEYEAKGLNFEIEDFYELIQNQVEFGEEEEEEDEGF